MTDTTDWWDVKQRFTHTTGAFLRLGDALYYMPANTEDHLFRRVVNLSEPRRESDGQGVFDFLDLHTGLTGTLACTSSGCVVYTQEAGAVRYVVRNQATDYGMPLELKEFDQRQTPTALFQMVGSHQMLYLSRGLHATPDTFSRAWLIDHAATTPWPINKGPVTHVDNMDGSVRRYRVGTYEQLLHLWPINVYDTGEWGGMDLQRIPDGLDNYEIQHDLTGELTSFAPKG